MLQELGFDSLESMTDAVVPVDIRLERPLNLPAPLSEQDALRKLKEILAANKPVKSLIGQGYFGAYMPQCLRKSGMVHGVYSLPAGDSTGASGDAHEFPDDDRRVNRSSYC